MSTQPHTPNAIIRHGLLRAVLAVLAVFVFFLLLIEGAARVAWNLSGAKTASLAALTSIPAPERHPTKAGKVHTVSEWPAGRARIFHEAPMLHALVTAGKLPSVDKRLPSEPQVIDHAGRLGLWHRRCLPDGEGDAGVRWRTARCILP